MDPITALSVASSVVALVEFGGKLIDRAFEIHRSASGQPRDAGDVLESSRELTSIATEARDRVNGLEMRYPRHGKLMDRLNAECAEVEKQLTQTLDTLTVKTSSRVHVRLASKVQVTIRSLWSEKQLEEWAKRLNGIRDQVMMSIIMCML